MVVSFEGNGASTSTLYKNFSVPTGIFEINYTLNITQLNDLGSEFYMEIDSYDGTKLLEINYLTDAAGAFDLRYYDGASYVVLENNLAYQHYYAFSLHRDRTLAYLTVFQDSTLLGIYGIELLDITKQGVELITFTHTTLNGIGIIDVYRLDDFAIYRNGKSLCTTDFGYRTLKPSFSGAHWDFQKQNLVNITAEGYFTLGASNGTYTNWNYETAIDWHTYTNNTPYFKNIYDNTMSDYPNGLYNPRIVVYLTGAVSIPTLYNLTIEGVMMNRSGNLIHPYYQSGSVDISESYYYVQNDRLHYHITANDSNLEYITATFNIPDIDLFNKTFLYTYRKIGNLAGAIYLSYTDGTTSAIILQRGERTEKTNLPVDVELNYFRVLITDDDLFVNKSMSGYFKDFTLRGSADYEFEITTVLTLEALIPLIFFIMFPSFLTAFYIKKQDKNDTTREKLMIPLLFVFSVVAFGFGQLPIWALFLMIIGYGALFYINYGGER
jgi:hypothetical protein